MTDDTLNDGTCDCTGCETPTPMDNTAIVFDGGWFCSPSCARTALTELSDPPQRITLHDPQFIISRELFPATVSKDDVGIQWNIDDENAATDLIDEIDDVFPTEFSDSN